MKQYALILAILGLSACSSPYAGPDMPKGTALPPPEETVAAPRQPDIWEQFTQRFVLRRAETQVFEGGCQFRRLVR